MVDRDLLGYWWSADHPDRKVPGTLRLSAYGKSLLELNGSLDDPERAREMAPHARVFGLTDNGQEVTLRECIPSHLHSSSNGYLTQSLSVSITYLGAHLSEAEEIFSTVEVRLDHLQGWLQSTGLRIAVPQQIEIGAVGPTIWSVALAPITGARPATGDFQILVDVSAERSLGTLSLTEDVYFRVVLAQPRDLHEITTDVLGPVRDLVSFALDRPVDIRSIILNSPTKARSFGDQMVPADIELVRQYVQPSGAAEESINPGMVLFTLPEYSYGFPVLLNSWLDLVIRGGASLNILLGLAYAPPVFHDNRLILLLYAAEAYHRFSMPDRAVHAASKTNAAAALAACPPDTREWLQGKLRHATEPSLRLRLSDLVRRAGPAVKPLIPKPPALTMRLSQVRNLYAHHGVSAEAPDGNELYALSQKLHWVLKLNVMRDIGLSTTEVATLVNRNQAFQHLVEQIGG